MLLNKKSVSVNYEIPSVDDFTEAYFDNKVDHLNY